jgi:hypothetical protein
MQDYECIQLYVASFNRYAVLAKWDEQALSQRFYLRLPNYIQNQLLLLPGGKPTHLN